MELDDAWLAGWTSRLRSIDGHRVLAVYLRGSHAHGAATPHSDVDFDVLVAGGPLEIFNAWLEPHGASLRHVSVAICDPTSFLNEMREPARWALGWPVRSPVRPLWIDPQRPELDIEALTHPVGDPLLEDAVEDLSKVASGVDAGNDTWVRLAASELAHEIPSLLRLVNPVRPVAHRRDVWDVVLNLDVAPTGYHDDMRMCLGWVPGGMLETARAAHRLVAGTLPLIRSQAHLFAKYGDLARALTDGRVDRYVAQLARDFSA